MKKKRADNDSQARILELLDYVKDPETPMHAS